MGRGAGAKLRGVQGLPLAAGAEDEEDGLHADPVGLAGPAAAEAVGVGVLGQQDGDDLPEVVGQAPLFRDGSIVHD
jgi:hypothetical protein